MTKKEKLWQKVLNNPRNVSLEDFESLIKSYGYIEEGGKHPKAIIDNRTMPYKRENPVKSYYVKELIQIIGNL